MFVPPSADGGWECQHDNAFWDAYAKYRLKEIDEEAFNRILK